MNKRNDTELSSLVWSLKEKGVSYDIQWKIVARAPAYSRTNGNCRLCTAEKFYIIFQPDSSTTLNARRDLVTTCRHYAEHLLC